MTNVLDCQSLACRWHTDRLWSVVCEIYAILCALPHLPVVSPVGLLGAMGGQRIARRHCSCMCSNCRLSPYSYTEAEIYP